MTETRGGPMSTSETFEALGRETFDLLIIGGGVVGAGAARDATLRGLRVAVVEKRDFGSGTSSASSKLVHGGLRYLQTFQFGLVRESTAERAVQMRVAPHLVRPMPFVVPVYRGDRHGLWYINMGLWLYDTLALFTVPRHRVLKPTQTLRAEPMLKKEGLRGALYYYDAATDDARLTLENIIDAADNGAVVANYARVKSLFRDGEGRVSGALVADVGGEHEVEVRARMTINTTGPWTDEVVPLGGPRTQPMLRLTKGSHLVFSRERLRIDHAVVLICPRDGRPLFAVPWGDQAFVGTTDTDYDGDLDEVFADAHDRDVILETIDAYFPEAAISPSDIVSSWSGLRPLIAPEKDVSASRVSREEKLVETAPRFLTMAGGKLTTYRLMARDIVDRAVRRLAEEGDLRGGVTPCSTESRPLPGAVGLVGRKPLEYLSTQLAARYGVAPDVAEHLAGRYGTRAHQLLREATEAAALERIAPPTPYLWAELDFAVRREFARTVEDVFRRRTQVALRHSQGGADAAERAAERIARLRGEATEEVVARDAAQYRARARGRAVCRDGVVSEAAVV